MVEAFFAAARRGDFDALVAVLHPGIVARADFSPRRPSASVVTRGADTVARHAIMGGALTGADLHRALINAVPGAVITVHGRPFAVMSFTVAEGRISEINVIGDPERVARIAAAVLTG